MSEAAGSDTQRLSSQNQAHRSYCCPHCGKQYAAVHHLNIHQRSACAPTKRTLSDLLQQTKAHWDQRKKRRVELHSGHSHIAAGSLVPHLPETPLEQVSREGPSTQSEAVPLTNRDSSQIPSEENNVLRPTAPHVERHGNTTAQEGDNLQLPLAQRKGKRRVQLPERYQQPPAPLPVPKRIVPDFASLLPVSLKELRNLDLLESERNEFGVVVRYHLPDNAAAENGGNLATSHTGEKNAASSSGETNPTPGEERNAASPSGEKSATTRSGTDPTSCVASSSSTGAGRFGPFDNKTEFLLAEWYWNSLNKSFSDFQRLVAIFRNPEFSPSDVVNANWRAAFKTLGANATDLSEDDASWITDDGWRLTPISIDIPFHAKSKDPGTKSYLVGNFRHRSLLSVIKERLTRHGDDVLFHYYPHLATWKRTEDSPEVELYGELYASRAFREAHENLQHQPSTAANRGLERVVVALMLWSDATHLTSFGGASLWPCYLFFGNESKYRRAQPSEPLGQQVAYFLKLPDKMNDHLAERNGGKLPSDALFAYCVRELLHKQWSILLDSDFVKAVTSGFVVMCPDGQERCFYPRIFTYLADYPEKIRIAGIRNNGGRPCHRCLIPKEDIFKLGSPSDTERHEAQRNHAQQESVIALGRAEIANGYAVNSSRFEEQFKALSLVPIHTAFTMSLSLDIGPALVVDILHEFEIGAWKKLYIHSIRLLRAFSVSEGSTLTAELDARYREMSAFGRDNIRKFPLNASAMQRKAARDFENLLQCAIPAFENLLPEPLNEILMTLLYICAQWHALAKLRLHNDLTLSLLEYTTAHLGAKMRRFDMMTAKTPTKELQAEADARARREVKKGKGAGSNARRPKRLGMYTIKFHFLGDYPAAIRRFGTTDSYSTQILAQQGELYHRSPKSWYGRTDRKDYETQLSQIERRQARLRQIRTDFEPSTSGSLSRHPKDDRRPISSYTLGTNQNCPIYLDFFRTIPNDDSVTWIDFIPDLKQHLLPRILERMGHVPHSVGRDAWKHVVLKDDRLYSHKILRVGFTAYDALQGEDVIHVDTAQCNVMLLDDQANAQAGETTHPYRYAKVNAVYHANVSFAGSLPFIEGCPEYHRLDFVWVHWHRFLLSRREFTLDGVAPIDFHTGQAFGFIDPASILRGVHLIPQFSLGKSVNEVQVKANLLSKQAQWRAYYVNRFADRDLFMRYQYGMSVGHTYTHASSFPTSQVPSIPADFDWCLDLESAEPCKGKNHLPVSEPIEGGCPAQSDGGTHATVHGETSAREASVTANFEEHPDDSTWDGDSEDEADELAPENMDEWDEDLDDKDLSVFEEVDATQIEESW